MRLKILILSTAGLVILGLGLIILGVDNAAVAQEKRSSFPPPTSKSPVIAPVPAVPPERLKPKPEENTPDQRPKEETSAEGKMRRAQVQAVKGQVDVGVIPGSASCPAGSELITIFMDDEDHNNANSRSGWIGAIASGHNTTFVFCRVDGTQFKPAEAPYAVLSLSPDCPQYSLPFSRYFDNEDSNNINYASGNINPNVSSVFNLGYTQLYFCLFYNVVPANTFPDLGVEYGVFASSLPTSGLASGHLHIDDEDQSNQNFFGPYYSNLGTLASSIISGDRNTDISIVKVRNAPPAPPPCLPKVLSYDGQLLNASYDGANCYIKAVVAGATPFIWSGGYYVTANKSTQCLAGTWDGANCYFMPKPAGGFLYKDAFYVPPGPGNTCSLGTFDGANCLVKAAPWGTHAFVYQNKWYFTPQFTCEDGAYDSANCYVMKAPAGTLPFIYNNAFYYKE